MAELRFLFGVMLYSKTILQNFYKLLMWITSYWFSSKPTINTINTTYLFTNNHSSHQQFVKKFVVLALLFFLPLLFVYHI